MSLQDQLDLITAKTRKLVQPDRLAISERATADLLHSGIESRVLPVGAQAPSFALEDAHTRRTVNSADLVALCPLIINFFRGRWCPYCITELETWRDLLPEVRSRGALFVAISPQTTRQNDFAIRQHALNYPMLSDPGAKVAESFGIAYTISPEHRRYFQSILVNIPFNNAGLNYQTATEESWRLPLPAVFIVDKSNIIRFSEAHADFRVRPEPASVLAALDTIK